MYRNEETLEPVPYFDKFVDSLDERIALIIGVGGDQEAARKVGQLGAFVFCNQDFKDGLADSDALLSLPIIVKLPVARERISNSASLPANSFQRA